MSDSSKKRRGISYAKWGYFFIIPFFLVYAIFSLYPLLYTIYISFFENYRVGLNIIGPNFIGIKNYVDVLGNDFSRDLGNTMIIWIMGFIPQIFISLLFASWFTDIRLKLKCTGFFKIVNYMPNILMASSVAVLFVALFSTKGPINSLIATLTNNQEYFRLPTYFILNPFADMWGTRGIAAFINFIMWYGNTTILLMAAILGIDPSLYESAQIDGASSSQTFRRITLPLIKPVLIFVLVTSLIGGIQLFDVPQLLTNGNGNPNQTSMTLVMDIYANLFNKNYGKGGAISVLMFIISAILSIIIFVMLREKKASRKSAKAGRSGK